jgi:nitrogen fixation NifU-like protein
MADLRELYQEVILDHSRHPRNFGDCEHANCYKDGFNPLCGDKISLKIHLDHDVIENISFAGEGCAISMASASLMTEGVKGKTTTQAKELFQQFHNMMTKNENNEDLGKLQVFSGVSEFPARVKCATLAWHTLIAALDHQVGIISTE